MRGPRVSDKSLVPTPYFAFATLFAIALASRIWAGVSLPNAEQDGYSYAEIAGQLTDRFREGHLTASDFYGFWLPLFQLGAAVLNIWVNDPIIAGKIINVLCGAVSLVLVFELTRILTGSIAWSVLTFLLLLADPFHVLYSASCMTDVPHTCLVLGSLWFVMQRRWLAAAIVAALAECMRVESWALIAALPLLQLALERRISVTALGILLIPPIGWLGLTYVATGNALAYFQERARYHAEYLQFHRAHGFTREIVLRNVRDFLSGAGAMITLGALAATIIAFWRFVRKHRSNDSRLLPAVTFHAAMLGLIFVAYISQSQPVLLPRYGLTFFTIGLPLFAWSLQRLLNEKMPELVKPVIVAVAIGACIVEMSEQVSTLGKVRNDFRAHKQIAEKLIDDLKQAPPGARCFSDNAGVRVLSRLPADRFLRTPFLPPAAGEDRKRFLEYLRHERAAFLVFFPTEDSVPVKFFPELGRSDQRNPDKFELITFARSTFGPDIWLYRLR